MPRMTNMAEKSVIVEKFGPVSILKGYWQLIL